MKEERLKLTLEQNIAAIEALFNHLRGKGSDLIKQELIDALNAAQDAEERDNIMTKIKAEDLINE